jgi:hypothetical protein
MPMSSRLGPALLAVAWLSLSGPADASRYVFSTFKGDTAPGERLSTYESNDGLNFTLVSDTGFVGTSGTLRDPSIMKYADGLYYVAYTNPPTASCCGREDHFSIASSPDLVRWSNVTTVPAGVPGVAHAWAPEWFVDEGVVSIIANIDTLNNDTDFKPYVFTATKSDLTAWSAPVPLGFGPNYIDAFVVKANGVYHAFTKEETTRFVEHATAASLTGPWTFVGRANWSGWGSGMEGPNIVRLDDGSWRIFLDGQNAVGFLYADSADLNTWSATKRLPVLADIVRHGTIIRDSPSGTVTPTGDAGDAGVTARDASLDALGPAKSDAAARVDAPDGRPPDAAMASSSDAMNGDAQTSDPPAIDEAGQPSGPPSGSADSAPPRDAAEPPGSEPDGNPGASDPSAGCGCRTSAARQPTRSSGIAALFAGLLTISHRRRAARRRHTSESATLN